MKLSEWIKNQRKEYQYAYGSLKEHNEHCMQLIEALLEKDETERKTKLALVGIEE